MLISYVLRLVPAAAVEGRIVGEVEAVATGRVRTIRSVDDLLALVQEEQREEGQRDGPRTPPRWSPAAG